MSQSTIPTLATLKSDTKARASTLLACVQCGYVPDVFSEGDTVIIQCRYDCNTSIGPLDWAIRDWNSAMKQKQDEEAG